MANITALYGSSTTITVTGLATLANGSSATSPIIDNTGDLNLDALIEVEVATASGATSTGYVEVYIKASVNGTDFDDDNNDKWAGTINLVTAGAATRRRLVSVASSFGGAMPPYWQIRVKNSTGGAFTAASVLYRGIKAQAS
jgi:hypothetical protein